MRNNKIAVLTIGLSFLAAALLHAGPYDDRVIGFGDVKRALFEADKINVDVPGTSGLIKAGYSTGVCNEVYEKIKASYRKKDFGEITKFVVKDKEKKVLGHLSLEQFYSPVFNSPVTHGFVLELVGDSKKEGISHITKNGGTCVLILAMDDKGPAYGHNIGLNGAGEIQITVNPGDKEVLLPSSTLTVDKAGE